MKLYLKIVGFILFTLGWFGVLIPWLVSARDDLLLAAGIAAIVAYPVFVYKHFKSEFDTVKTKMENL